MKAEHPTPTSSADGVAWDLSDLYASTDDPKIASDLQEAKCRADSFAQQYRGQLAQLDNSSFYTAIAELQSILEQADAPVIFAHLLHASKSDNPDHGKLLSTVMEQSSIIRTKLVFFELEWSQLDENITTKFINADELQPFRHFLEKELLFQPHRLDESVETALEIKSNTGSRAFSRLFDEITGRIQCEVELPKETKRLNESETLALLHDPDREVRKAASIALTRSLDDNQHVLTYIFNVLLQDHKVDDQLRSFKSPMASRNLANEIDQNTVDALMTASENAYPTVQRFYRLKKKLLGLDELFDYDRYAPIFLDQPSVEWSMCREIITESYRQFSPEAGEIVEMFFDKKWIDAELRSGKRGGAFSASGPSRAHPYILCNYTDRMRDVMTVAHELGHGIHQYLSQEVGYLQAHTPLTTAETASVFGEMIVFHRLMEGSKSPRDRLALLTGKIEDAFATVFRQIVLSRFEQLAHTARRSEGELNPNRIGELWIEANSPMHGDTVTLTDNYSRWWSYIPHFIHTPFYTYAYSFGELLVLALYRTYEIRGADFVPDYMDMLRKGGSVGPAELVRPLGMDISDASFWNKGLSLLEVMVKEADSLADEL
tara:strand:+ start:11490 stop:13298 length:1809 start_codon:yes stop_codon:yes gene_type:complete